MTDKTLKQKIEETTEKETYNGIFDGTIKVEEFSEHPCFYASIELQKLKKITLKFNPEFEKKKPGKTLIVARDITRHEINHKKYRGFNGCPRTLDNHVKLIFEPMADVLGDYSYSDIKYITNAFEDTVLQDDFGKSFTLDGIVEFFDDVGSGPDEGFSEFYEAHVKLNLMLWGRKKQKKQLRKYFKNSEGVKEVLQNFLKKTGIMDLKESIVVNGEGIEIKDRNAIRQYLNDEGKWPEIARIYAEEFSKLMKPGYALPLLNHSGSGTKGNPQPENPEDGNQFDKEMRGSEYKQKRIQEAYVDGEGIPTWIEQFEALDLLYQSLAQRLQIKIETFTKQMGLPIFWHGKRPFNPEKDNLKHITFEFSDTGEVELKKKRWHEDIPLQYKVSPKGFPEIKYCFLDTSSSMRESPAGDDNSGNKKIIPWGDNSKYHYALLGWYGMLEYLKQNHLLQQTNISLTNFSSETHTKSGLMEAKKLALQPQFGNTTLDLEKVRNMFKNHGMLVFTITDGEISNWQSIKEEFIKLAKQHHYFHLQIGNANQTTKYLEKAGLKVEYITNAKDLATKVIDLTYGACRK